MNIFPVSKLSLHGGMAPSRILLVDDDAALLEGLAEMLTIRLQPVHVDTCHGSRLAVKMVQQGQYDVILCDVWMPVMNGLELLPRLRKTAPEAPF
jgi:CheY-like chemotaxis protein